MMLQGNLPQSLWAEAVNAATYIRNRCATKSLNGETPFEAWSKRTPYVNFFRIIGSKAIVLNKAQGKGKFQPKGDEYVLVGYSEESKAYRLWKPGTRTVIKARDVRFFENQNLTNTTKENPIGTSDDKETSYIPLEQPESQDVEHQDDREDDEDTDVEESTSETTRQGAPDENDNKVRHGRGRPKLMKTGKPGRPKKVYQTRNTRTSDPESVSEALDHDDREA